MQRKPDQRVFAWTLRRSYWVRSRFHVTSAGVTPWRIARGSDYAAEVLEFGETVHYRDVNLRVGSKWAAGWRLAT
eukprot:7357974-Alexandrium_andersonii.AAC.1